jgi:hypothetical protein
MRHGDLSDTLRVRLAVGARRPTREVRLELRDQVEWGEGWPDS